jgi:hypothetical protein
MTLVESTLTEDSAGEDVEPLGWIVASCSSMGQPVQIMDVPVRGAKKDVGGGYTVEIRKGKKWVQGLVPASRLSVPSASFANGKLEGSIWFFERDRVEAESKLRDGLRAALITMKSSIEQTLQSLT